MDSHRDGPPGRRGDPANGSPDERSPGAERHRALDPRVDYEARLRGHELAGLSLHWGEAYEITWTNGMFRAARRDNGAALWADSIAELRELIKNDSLAKRVMIDGAG